MMARDMIFLLVLFSAGTLAVLSFWLDGRLRKARCRQQEAEAARVEYQQQLLRLERQLAAGLAPATVAGPADRSRREGAFAGPLGQAGLRLRLRQGPVRTTGVVERYRLMAAMARQGLAAQDISAVLRFSDSETEQLLKLSRVGRRAAA
ncbi:MAG: hypothetical protein L3J03_01470 [Desulfobacterales bacterium]|nr:hypothetical protein [Desulfobacterales bacterium]